MDKKWDELTPEQKMEARFETWLEPEGVNFKSPEAKASYQAKITRLKDVIQLKKTPDRVPVFPFHTFLPADLMGVTNEEVMYDVHKLVSVWKDYLQGYEPDYYISPALCSHGPLLDILDYKLYKWPGHGVMAKSPYQCMEKEYMEENDYDALIDDPTDFWLRTYLPRICGSLDGLKFLAPFTDNFELPALGGQFVPLGLPEVQKALQTLMDAGRVAFEWIEHIAAFENEAREMGYVNGAGGISKAPFDVIGDTLRGTQAIMIDIFRQPKKLLKALERITPILIKMGLNGVKASGNPIVFMPLHKGADGFMSDEKFKTFYWPFLKEVFMGLVDEGCVPLLFAEGGYNSRLEYLKEIPAGHTIWMFDRTDVFNAKKEIGGNICIAGNVPVTMLLSSTPEEVGEYCKKLIDTVGKNGGFIMTSGTSLDESKPDTLHAMIDVTKEYGVYK